ncbi:MAG: sulfatase-like hydrolase/transferase [Sedimentisphaerales bacterium]|nr:sulfatase-like hydrolase/transferase [Sedimentisphaerales bacterium]
MQCRKIHRRDFLKRIGAAAAATVLSGRLGFAQKKRPNFIVMIADDLAWNDVGCFGHPTIQTPNLDRMAGQGMRFTSAFLTTASCSPTRCSVITGRYPHSTGAGELHQPLPADQVTFPSLLKQDGYYTAAAGKWHLGNDAKQSFDKIYGGGPSGCEQWLTAMRERPVDTPFFLWLAAFDPHRGYQENTIETPHKPEDMVVPPFLPDVPQTRKDLALYCDEATRMDGFIGKVLDEVDRQGIAEDTFILFFSDNGRPFARCKTRLYDSGIKTPLMIQWKNKIKPGSICDSLVSVVDIAATMTQLADLPKFSTFEGVSFCSLLEDPQNEVRQYVFGEHNWHDYQAHERSVRSKDFLYIRNDFPHLPGTPPADAVRSITYQTMLKLRAEGRLDSDQHDCFIVPRPTEELYDVKRDPYSLHNLASDSAHARILETMRQVHADWARKTKDRIPANPTLDQFDRITGNRLRSG